MTEQEAIAIAQAEAEQPNVIGDMGKGALAGISQGITGLLDLPSLIGKGMTAAADAILPQSIVDSSRSQRAAVMADPQFGGAAQAIAEGNPLTQAAGILSNGQTNYEPTTEAGKMAKSSGQFLSNALLPGGLARKTASVLLPGVASEGLGYLTEGSDYEPYARLAGGLTGMLSSVQMGRAAAKVVHEAAKTAKHQTGPAMKQAVADAYDALRAYGVYYNPKAYSKIVMDAKKQLKHLPSSIAPKSNKLLDELFANPLLDFNDLDAQSSAVGKALRSAMNSGDNAEAAGLTIVKQAIDDFEVNPTFTGIGNRQHMRAMRRDARTLAKQLKKSELVTNAVDQAQFYPGGLISGLNAQIGGILRNKKLRGMFGPGEISLLENVLTGKSPLSAISMFFINRIPGVGLAMDLGDLARTAGGVAGNPTMTNIANKLPTAIRGGEAGAVAAQKAVDAATRAEKQRRAIAAGNAVNATSQ